MRSSECSIRFVSRVIVTLFLQRGVRVTKGLPVSGNTWTEVTSRPSNADDPRDRDPFASNSGAGNGFATDGGAHWSRLGHNLPYTTAMDVDLGPDGRVDVATHGCGIWSITKP
jgi:hypothetical protein